jgi:hypothetical protein
MIAEALAAYADATAGVFEGREQTIGAREIGQCAGKLFWIKNEDDPFFAAPRSQLPRSLGHPGPGLQGCLLGHTIASRAMD